MKTIDRREQNRLVRRYRYLVAHVAAGYARSSPLDYEDLKQEGMLGLMLAVKTYDPSKGTAASTWVHTRVSRAIQQAVRDQSHPMRLTSRATTDLLRYSRAVEKLTQSYAAKPTLAEIAAEMGVSERRVLAIETYVPDTTDVGAETGKEGLTLAETIPEAVENLADHTRAVDAILEALPDSDGLVLDASLGLFLRKSSRERIAHITDLTVREVDTALQRIKRQLRRDPAVLALKEATGYETEAERRAREGRLPRHAGVPRPPKALPGKRSSTR